MIKKHILLVLFLFVPLLIVQSQIQIKVIQGKKEVYQAGDKIQLQIRLKTIPKTCVDGMKRANVFVSGLEIESQTDWEQIATGLWQRNISAVFVPTKKNTAKITVMRQVDIESLFQQLVFVVKNP